MRILTDSTCDLPDEILDKFQVQIIPINITADGSQYLDRLTITPQHFYKILKKAKNHPSTSQPGTKEFQNKLSHMATHYDSVMAITLSKNFSGTWSNCEKAAETVRNESGKRISVINSKTVSAGLGLLMLRTLRCLEKGVSHSELEEKITEWTDKNLILVNPKTMKYFVRGGRVSPVKGFIANLVNLKPIISVDKSGKTNVFSKSFSRKGSMKKVLKIIERTMKDKKVYEYCVVYSNEEEKKTAEWYAGQLKEMIGKEAAYISTISPVVGANAGIGTVAVSVMFE